MILPDEGFPLLNCMLHYMYLCSLYYKILYTCMKAEDTQHL